MANMVTRKGQVTIPKGVRDRLGIEPGSLVEFSLNAAGQVTLAKQGETAPANSVARFRGIAGPGMSTDEIMALLRDPL